MNPAAIIHIADDMAKDVVLRHKVALANQIEEAIQVLRSANRPLKYNRIKESFTHMDYQVTERMIRNHPNVVMTRHKGNIYYQYSGDQS